MKSLTLGIALALGFGLVACKTDAASSEKAGKQAFTMAAVDEVDQWITADKATAVDANNAGTREKMGTLPGAIKLTSYDGYNVSELPADKARRLVFYCANTQCEASHDAANKAIAAGYTDVEVMPDGIAGWVNAGKKVDKI
jgi:rhodanese-related sulfurtransferase